jgi:hypothetical protein
MIHIFWGWRISSTAMTMAQMEAIPKEAQDMSVSMFRIPSA